MRLFLDTSVLLAASGSHIGAARIIIENARAYGWVLLASPYVLAEVDKNISKLGKSAPPEWAKLKSSLIVVPDVVSAGRVVVFDPTKDRPILLTAFARAQALLTHDVGDFAKLGGYFHGLEILTPGEFLQNERKLGRFDPRNLRR